VTPEVTVRDASSNVISRQHHVMTTCDSDVTSRDAVLSHPGPKPAARLPSATTGCQCFPCFPSASQKHTPTP
jgi:hypothetical protein